MVIDVNENFLRILVRICVLQLTAKVKLNPDTLDSVSYTHLDVYKRQIIYFIH